MYSLVLAATLFAGNAVPDFHKHGGKGCYGGCYGCYGYSSCYGCCGGCYGCYGYSSCYGCCGGYSSCYGCCGGCYGCYGCYGYSSCYGCCGGYAYSSCYGCYGSSPVYGGGSTVVVVGGSSGAARAPTQVSMGGGGAAAAQQGNAELKQALDSLKKEVEQLKKAQSKSRSVKPPVLPKPKPDQAVIRMSLPAGARLFVNEIPVAPAPVFVTPALKPGTGYHYNFRVVVSANGQTMTRSRRVPVQAGAIIDVAFADMQPGATARR